MSLNESYELAREFHITFSLPAPPHPHFISAEHVERRSRWIREELEEFARASTLVEQVDAMIDVVYLALGGLVEMGVRPDAVFRIVHEANMAKLWADGRPRHHSDGKISKPAGWVPPDARIFAELEQQSVPTKS